ncbi:MAG: GTP cyclohydrolase II [Proteobacteria bacterium]|nr:GTP cyclohydrolase II [Pseudomonadota bacterium]
MFTYLDPAVRQRLTKQGKLFRIDRDGTKLEAGEAGPPGSTISILGPIPLPLQLCDKHFDVQWYACVRNTELDKIEELADELRENNSQRSFATLASFMAVNSVLVVGDPQAWVNPLVRVHSSCLTGDVFGSQRCDCGPQMHAALERIRNDKQGGLVIYMSGHEGRGIGLWAKAATYLLQDAGEDTYQANRTLGLPDDSRDFSDAAALLKYFLDDQAFRLLTNNPKKVDDLTRSGLGEITRVKHVSGVTDDNRRYLSAKQDWGHKLSAEDIGLD